MRNVEYPRTCLRGQPREPRGFSFTEILFAVMILGIGFIMIAAMFPVAIHQTEANNQETITASVVRGSSNYLAQLAAMPLPQATIAGYTPTGVTPAQTPSILLPTFPSAALPAANVYTLPPGRTSMVVPGQTWTLFDGRDAWVYSFVGPPSGTAAHNAVLWQSAARNFIQPGDARFGWAAMYRRDMVVTGSPAAPATAIEPAPYAQVIMVGMQTRNTLAYNPSTDLPNPPTSPPAAARSPFLPFLVGDCTSGRGVSLVLPVFAGGPSYADFSKVTTPTGMLAEGAYLVVSNDNVPTTTIASGMWHGALNGRILRLGGPPATSWPLLPGSDFTSDDVVTWNNMKAANGGTPPQFDVLVVGRGARIPTVPGNPFDGPAQDVTAYTTFLQIPN